MSSFIVTSINVDTKQGKVFLSGYSSNVSPKTPSRFESSYLSDMLRDHGAGAVDSYLLEQYAGGMMRGGNNEYANTIKIYGTASLENLAKLRSVKQGAKGQKYYLKNYQGYVTRMTSRRAFLSPYSSSAKQFSFVDAMVKASRYQGMEVVPA